MIEEKIRTYLLEEGWIITSVSPFEMGHTDGSIATGLAARIVYDFYRDELHYCEDL